MTRRACKAAVVVVAGFLVGWLVGRGGPGASGSGRTLRPAPTVSADDRAVPVGGTRDAQLAEALRICRSFPDGIFAGDRVAILEELLDSLAAGWATEADLRRLAASARELCWLSRPLEVLARELESRTDFETIRNVLLHWSSQVSAEELFLSLSEELRWRLVRSGQVVPAIFGRRSREIIDSFLASGGKHLSASEMLAIRLTNRAVLSSSYRCDDPWGTDLEASRSELVALMSGLSDEERNNFLASLAEARVSAGEDGALWFDAVLHAFPPDECIGFVQAVIRYDSPSECLRKFGEAIARAENPSASLARALSAWQTQSPRREIVMGFSAATNSGLSGDESAALAALVDDRHQQENLRASAADSLVRRDGPDGLAEIDLPLDKKTAIAFRAADERWAQSLFELALAGRLDPAQALRWFDSRPELSRQLDPGSLARLREVVSPPPQPE